MKLGKDLENLQQDLHQRQLAYEQSLEEAKKIIAGLQEARSQLQSYKPIQGANTEDISNENHEEKEDNSADSHSKKIKEANSKILSIEEANIKMQAEMSRAVEYIEVKYKEREVEMQQKLDLETQKASAAELLSAEFEGKLITTQEQLGVDLKSVEEKLQSEYLAKENDIMDRLNAQKKRADLSEETNVILKGELEELMMKLSENSPPQMGDVIDKLSEERQLRTELEVELSNIKLELSSHSVESQHVSECAETSSQTVEDPQILEEMSKSKISIEEVNQKMQDEMTRAIDHIESQFKIKENQLLYLIEEEKRKVTDSEGKLANFEIAMKTDLTQMQSDFDNEKSNLSDKLAAMTRKAQLAEESGKIMKEEMDKLVLRFTETDQPQMAEVVDKLTAETELRVKLEAELEAIKFNNKEDIAKEIIELKKDISVIQEEKLVMEKQLLQSEKLVYEKKIEHLMQRLLSKEERLGLDNRLASGDQSSDQEALVIKLALLADELYRMEGGRERIDKLQNTVPDKTAEVPFLLDDVLQQMQMLESEKHELQSEIKRLKQAQGDVDPVHKSEDSEDGTTPTLDKQVDIFMNRDLHISNDASDITQVPESLHNVNISYHKQVTELIQKLDISVDIRQHIEKELHVIIQRAGVGREAELQQELAIQKEKLRALMERQSVLEQGMQPDHDPEIIEQLSMKLKVCGMSCWVTRVLYRT